MSGKSNVPANSSATADGTVSLPPSPFQIMLRAMANDATAEDGNFGGDDLNAILSAQTEEELWDSDDRPPLNFQHLSGCEISILDVNVKFSRGSSSNIQTPFVWTDERGQEKKMYLLVKCVRISSAGEKSIMRLPAIGEEFTANTSARYVVAKIWRAMTMGLFNANTGRTWEALVTETDLGDNQAVIKLRPIPKRATTATTL